MRSNHTTRSVLSNPRSERVRRVRALLRRAGREKEGRFVVEGPQGVREAVAWRTESVVDVYVDEAGRERCAEIVESALAAGLYVHDVSAEVLAQMSDTASPQGIVAVVERPDVSLDAVLANDPRLIVVLASVRDPGNAGTVLRGADAMGADAVIIGEASVDLYNPKVVRSTVGSLFHLPVVVGAPVASTLARLREAGVVSYAADGAGRLAIGDADLTRPHAWVMGNEAWGLPDELLQACDEVVSIPLHRAESLNLAMAATICMYASAAARG
ncbi:MAG: RNA methyltransferase [Dermatophilus congolensis]|nr:RNA methyltransferase [Dermatophilus congolensis]